MLSRLVREKVRPAALCHRESAKKFALRAHNGPKLAFLGVLGEFFRANRCCAGLGCSAVHFRLAAVGGFCSIRSLASTCRRRVGVLMMQFPLWGDAGQIRKLGCMLCAQQFRMQFPCDSFKI